MTVGRHYHLAVRAFFGLELDVRTRLRLMADSGRHELHELREALSCIDREIETCMRSRTRGFLISEARVASAEVW